jgi:hypothetical protein
MIARLSLVLYLTALALTVALAKDLPSTLFAETPPPAAGELLAPCAILADQATGRLIILDSGLQRITAMTPAGAATATWPFADLGVARPAELAKVALLPSSSLQRTSDTLYLLAVDRPARKAQLVALEGQGENRTVALPNANLDGAFALDPTGHLLAARLRIVPGNVTLYIDREGDDGALTPCASLDHVAGDEWEGVSLTGLTVAGDGRIALGLAQTGDTTKYSYVRAWLAQGELLGNAVLEDLQITHQETLIDADGNLLDRYRAAKALAGKLGYPVKPCVPLFTSLAFVSDEAIISGGCPADPFLRTYGRAGELQHSLPRAAQGGQQVAVLLEQGGPRIFTVSPEGGRVEEYTLDGRFVCAFGRPAAFSLAEVVALAAATDGVYAAARWASGYYVVRFDAEGSFLWAQPIAPPRGMATARPWLCAPAGDAVYIGWRVAGATGVGYVDTLTADGLPGRPLWDTPVISGHGAQPPLAPPLVVGRNGRLYVVREMTNGPRVYVFSATGTWLQTLPTGVKQVSLVGADSTLALFRPDRDGTMAADLYNAAGENTGWKTTHRDGAGGMLIPALTQTAWGWLSTTHTLLHFDETFTVVSEDNVMDPGGDRLLEPTAVCGDGAGRLYFAMPGMILTVATG